MRKSSLRLRLILVGCVLGFGAAEAAARLWFSGAGVNGLATAREEWMTGGGPTTGFSERAQDGETFRPHPLFGYVGIPGKLAVNKFGFFSGREFALCGSRLCLQGAPAGSVVVGLFGGSLALQVGSEERLLEELLARHFPGRRVAVVNFAMPGYAAPQTLAVYRYFRHAVQVAVFLDGLNEIWNPVQNNRLGYPPVFAKAEHFRLLSGEASAEREALLRLRRRLVKATERSLIPAWRGLALAHALWSVERSYLLRRISEVAGTAPAGHGPFFAGAAEKELVEAGVEEWEHAHRQAQLLAREQKAALVHFLQPTAFAGGKRLTAEEEKALASVPALRPLVKLGYPALRARAKALGVSDLTGLFDAEPGPVWIDPAHVNARGIELLRARLAAAIGELKPGRY